MQVNHRAYCLAYTKLFINISYYFKRKVEQFGFIRQQTASATDIISTIKARGCISLFVMTAKAFQETLQADVHLGFIDKNGIIWHPNCNQDQKIRAQNHHNCTGAIMIHSSCCMWVLSIREDKVGVLLAIMKSRVGGEPTLHSSSAVFFVIMFFLGRIIQQTLKMFLSQMQQYYIISLGIVSYIFKCEHFKCIYYHIFNKLSLHMQCEEV